jgi:hypothetical protein
VQNGLIVLSYINPSEIGRQYIRGNVVERLHPAAERSTVNTLARAASQGMDTVSYERKEFWPDIRRMLQQMVHKQ